MFRNIIRRFHEGYEWKPWTPYQAGMGERIHRGIHHALSLHYPNRGGSWSFGYDYVCGGCGMGVGKWPEEKCKSMGKVMDRLEEQGRYPFFMVR